MRKLLNLYLILSSIRLIPHLCVLQWHSRQHMLQKDLEVWVLRVFGARLEGNKGRAWWFIKLMTHHPEYRSLFYFRIGLIKKLLSPLCAPMDTLYISTVDIGEGLFIQHGFATIMSANRIGKNCWINQQVTIGFSHANQRPTLGDNVTVNAGAKIIGEVTLGDNVIVGANAVVVKDVPANCTVVGVPAYIIKRDGVKTREPL